MKSEANIDTIKNQNYIFSVMTATGQSPRG